MKFQSIAAKVVTGGLTIGCLGWYLMLPPQGTRINAPLSQWNNIAKSDSIKECETNKTILVNAAKHGQGPLSHEQMINATLNARCIDELNPQLGDQSVVE